MGCRLDNFEVTGFQRRIADDVLVVPARTKERRIEGVMYFVSGVFCGFTGSDSSALEAAKCVRHHTHKDWIKPVSECAQCAS